MIDQAVLFALLSLTFGGLNEIVFKRYSASERSRGMMIGGIGLVWATLLLIDVDFRGDAIEISRDGLAFGLAAGLAVALANILLLESLRHMEVSLGSTIYRLNTIAVLILSVLFLGESLGVMKLSGVICGIIAVLLLYSHHSIVTVRHELRTGLVMVTIAALLRAVYGVVTKQGLDRGSDMDLLLLIAALCWMISGFLYARFIEHRYSITAKKIVYALLSGCLVYGIVRTLLTALALGEASIVITIANLSFLVALIVAIILKMEHLSARKLLAMGFAVGAIYLLSRA